MTYTWKNGPPKRYPKLKDKIKEDTEFLRKMGIVLQSSYIEDFPWLKPILKRKVKEVGKRLKENA